MRRKKEEIKSRPGKKFFVFFALLVLAALLVITASAVTVNIVNNPSFEYAISGADWNYTESDANAVINSGVVAVSPTDGTYSYLINVSGTPAAVGNYGKIMQPLNLTGILNITFDVNVSSTLAACQYVQARVYVDAYDGRNFTSAICSGSSAFLKNQSINVTGLTGMHNLSMELYINLTAVLGLRRVHFDNVRALKLNNPPTQSTPILNSTFGTNLSTENLTCYNQSTADSENDAVKSIYNWFINGTSVTELNMPFEGGSNSTFANDYSGFSNDGLVLGPVWSSTAGYDGKGAYIFDGGLTNNSINISDSVSLNITSAITIAAWAKVSSNASDMKILAKQGSTSGGYKLSIYPNATGGVFRAEMEVRNASSTPCLNRDIAGGTNIIPGTWYFIVGIYDNSSRTLKTYVNGQLDRVANTSNTACLNATAPPFTASAIPAVIGRESFSSTPANYFNGTIDDMVVYNYALSPAQITSLYRNQTNMVLSQDLIIAQNWTCQATPNDGYQDGTMLVSNSLLIRENIPPVVLNLTPSAGTNYTNGTVVNITANVTDNYAMGSVSANITWDATSQLIAMSNASSSYNATFTNTQTIGLYNVTIIASDRFGNVNNTVKTNFTITFVDSIKPVVVSNLPANDFNTSSTSINFNWTGTDNFDTNLTCNLTIGNVVNATNVSSLNNTATNFSVSNFADGTNLWNVTCWDDALNKNTSAVRNFTIDGTFPNVTLVSPSETSGTSIGRSNIVVNSTAIDTHLLNVTISLYNRSNLLINSTSSATSPDFVNYTNLADGIYYFNATGYDNFGNKNTTETRNVTIDTVKPSIALNLPAGGLFTNVNAVNFNWTATNGQDTNLSCNLSINNVVNATNVSSLNNTATNFSVGSFANGFFLWNVTCIDDASNMNTSLTRNFTMDTSGPNLSAVLPVANSTFLLNGTVQIAINATDTNGIGSAYANVTYPNGSVVSVPLALAAGSRYNATFADLIQNGIYNVTIFVNDTLGNVNTTFTYFNRIVAIQNTSFDVIDQNNNTVNFTQTILQNNSGLIDVQINFTNQTIMTITVYSFNSTQPFSLIRIARNTTDYYRFSNTFGADLSGAQFLVANITLNATGNTLYKCLNFTFGNLTCNDGSYEFVQYLTAGQLYAFSVNSTDPGFGDSSPDIGTPDTGTYVAFANGYSGTSNTYTSTQANDAVTFGVRQVNIGANLDLNAYLNLSYNLTNLTSIGANASKIINLTFVMEHCFVTDNFGAVTCGVAPGGTIETAAPIEMYNWTSGAYNQVGNYTGSSTSEGNATVTVTGGFSDFINRTTNFTNIRYKVNVTITVNGNDAAFGADYAPLTVTYDIIKPAVLLNATINGFNSSSRNITFNWTATDNFDTNLSCNLSIDNAVNASNIPSLNYTMANFTVLNIYDGTHLWNVTCFDDVFNANTSETRNFTVDSTKPAAALNYPPGGIITSNTSFNFNWTAVDDFDTNLTCNLTINGTVNVSNIPSLNNTPTNYTITGFTDGFRLWNVTCIDDAGNTNTSATRNFTIDTVAPSINFTAPTETSGLFINRSYIRVNVTANNSNLANITIYLYNSSNVLVNSTTATSPNFANYTGLADGIYYFNATALDLAGNSNSTETRNVTIDTIKPAVQFTAPTETSGTTINRNNILVNVTAIDTNFANITIRLYNSTLGLINSTTATSPNFANYTGLADGIYYFNATALDLAGNSNSTETRNTTIYAQAPSINFTSPTPQNNTVTKNTSIQVNISIANTSDNSARLDEFKWNWNGTNYTLYDNSLVLMMNFDNVSVLGETSASNFTRDVSSYNNSGNCTNMGGGCSWTAGRYNNALSFNGINTYVNVPPSTSLSITNEITIEAWVFPTDVSAQYRTVANKGTSMDVSNYWFGITYDEVDFSFNTGGWKLYNTVSANLQPNTWYHIVVVYNDAQNNVTIYVNGVQQYSNGSVASSLTTNAEALQIGSDFFNEGWDGRIDELRIYNRSLGAEEIRQDYYSNLYKYDADKWQFYTNQLDLTNGTFSYFGCARNKGGNQNCTEKRYVNINKTFPVFNNVSPTAGSQYNQTDTVYLAINTSENSTVTANITLDSTSQVINLAYNGTDWWYNSTFTNTTTPGLYNVTFSATSIYNVSNTTTTNFTVNDITPPIVLNITPLPGSNFTNGSSVQITANVTELYYNSIDTVLANVSWAVGSQLLAMNNISSNYSATFTNTTYAGAYNVTIIANDSFANINDTQKTNFTVVITDAAAPVVSLNYPPGGLITSNTSFDFNWTAVDDFDTNLTCNLTINGTVNVSNIPSLNNTPTNYTITGFTDGFRLWNVTCIDDSGNSNVSETRNVTVDTTAPAIGNTTPQNGTTYNQTNVVYLSVNVSENSTVTANITWDSTSQIINLTFNGTQWIYNATFNETLVPGRHNITINATDYFNNSNTSSAYFYVNDTTAPNVIILYPQNGTNYSANVTILFSANATDYYYDSIGTVYVNITLPNGTTQILTLVEDDNTQIFNATFNSTALIGRYNFTLFANDTSGNYNTSTGYFIILLNDTTPPSFNGVSPAPGSQYNQTNNVTFAVNLSENATVFANITWDSTSQIINLTYNGTGWWFNTTFNQTIIPGLYNVTINATDPSGNSNLTYTNFTINDVTLPTVTIISPLATAYNYTYLPVNITATDNTAVSQIWFDWNGTNTNYTVPVEINFTDNSTITLVAYANDTAGNINSTNVTFIVNTSLVDTSPPVISNINATTTNETAVINFTTNEGANVTIDYGTSTGFGSTASNASFVTSHSILLSSLINNTLYYYNISSCDVFGNCNTSGVYNFTTQQNNVTNFAPLVVLNKPDNQTQSNNTNSITLNFTVTDDLSAALSCDLYINGILNQTNSSVQNNTMTNLDLNVSFGTYNWYINCTDGSLYNVSETRIFYINDTFGPSITIIFPLAATYNYTYILVNISATDSSGISQIWFDWNGTNTNYTVPMEINFTDNSTITLVAYANDTLNNVNSTNVTFTVNTSFIDTTPPVISGVGAFDVSNDSAEIMWSTDEAANATINYGTTAAFGNVISDGSFTTGSGIIVSDLINNTLYYYNVTSCDIHGNCNTSGIYNFTTAQNTADTTPPATITNLNETQTTNESILWNWTNPTDPDFNHTEIWIDGTFQANVSVDYYNATGLQPNTTYEIQTRTVDSLGNINTEWVNDTARTNATHDTTPPVATNITATATNATARINWTTDELSNSTIRYGTTTALGTVKSNSTLAINHSALLTGLVSNTLYYYNITACDISGNCNTSGVFNFTTLQAADITAPNITGHTIIPRDPTAGNFTFINATATDNVNVSAIFVNITLPNGTIVTSPLPYNYSPPVPGRYNITIFVNDTSGNTVSVIDYFIAGSVPLFIQVNVVNNSFAGIDTNLSVLFMETGGTVESSFFTGQDIQVRTDILYDLLFMLYNNSIIVRLNSINFTIDTNSTLGADKTQVGDFLVTYGFISNYTFANAILTINYSALPYTDESLFEVYKCSNWSFSARGCISGWAQISFVIDTAGKTVSINTTGFSAYSIKQGVAEEAAGHGGGGGTGTTGAPVVMKEYMLIVNEIPKEIILMKGVQQNFIVEGYIDKHSMTPTEIANDYVIISLDRRNITIPLGREVKVDVNGDGREDMSIFNSKTAVERRINGETVTEVYLSIWRYGAGGNVTVISGGEEKPAKAAENASAAEKPVPVSESQEKKEFPPWIIVLFILLVLLALLRKKLKKAMAGQRAGKAEKMDAMKEMKNVALEMSKKIDFFRQDKKKTKTNPYFIFSIILFLGAIFLLLENLNFIGRAVSFASVLEAPALLAKLVIVIGGMIVSYYATNYIVTRREIHLKDRAGKRVIVRKSVSSGKFIRKIIMAIGKPKDETISATPEGRKISPERKIVISRVSRTPGMRIVDKKTIRPEQETHKADPEFEAKKRKMLSELKEVYK